MDRSHLYKQSCCHVINEKKGADEGIDGMAYFKVGKKDNAKLSFGPNQGAFLASISQPWGRCAADGIPSRRPHHHLTAQEIVEGHKRFEIPMSIEVRKAAQRSLDSEPLFLL
jgi:hypothetical protein